MKIALTVPLYTLGSDGQGGIGTFVIMLAKELIKRGHDVDVFTVGTSKIEGNKIAIYEKGIFDELHTPYVWASLDIGGSVIIEETLTQFPDKYDVIHNNKVDFYAFLKLSQRPNVITTFHQDAASPGIATARQIRPETSQSPYVAISNFQKDSIDLNFIDTVHNGIDLNPFTYSEATEPYVAWMARIDPTKGIREAIELAAETDVELKFAGSNRDQKYYDETLALAKTKGATFLGHADAATRDSLMGKARAFLFPMQWDEPFGFILTEAMACGTPVITYNRGAASEIVIDGVTGFLCPPNDKEAMKAAIHKIMTLPDEEYLAMRRACRKHVEENFTIEKMVDGYERVYDKIRKATD